MYKNVLRKLNFFFFLLILFFIITIQSTIFTHFPFYYFQPDLFLILSVYFGFKRNLLEGVLFIIFMLCLMGSHSSVGFSFFLCTYLYVFLLAKGFKQVMIVTDMPSTIGIVCVLTALQRLGTLLLLYQQGIATNGVYHFLVYLFPTLLSQVFFTPVCFFLFRQLDFKTYKNEHAEDEYHLNKEY